MNRGGATTDRKPADCNSSQSNVGSTKTAERGRVDHPQTESGGNNATGGSASGIDFLWSCPNMAPASAGFGGPVRHYRYPTLGADRTDFVRARADPLACNLDNDMVLLWTDLAVEDDERCPSLGHPASEESIEDAYQRLFAAAVRHREDLQATLRDAGLERVNQVSVDSVCDGVDPTDGWGSPTPTSGAEGDLVGDVLAADTQDGCFDVFSEDDDDDVIASGDLFDDSGVRGSWELLDQDLGFVQSEETTAQDDPLALKVDLSDGQGVWAGLELRGHGTETRPVSRGGVFTERPCTTETDIYSSNNNIHNNSDNINNYNSSEINNTSTTSEAEPGNGSSADVTATLFLSTNSSSRFDSGLYDSSCSDEDKSDMEQPWVSSSDTYPCVVAQMEHKSDMEQPWVSSSDAYPCVVPEMDTATATERRHAGGYSSIPSGSQSGAAFDPEWEHRRQRRENLINGSHGREDYPEVFTDDCGESGRHLQHQQVHIRRHPPQPESGRHLQHQQVHIRRHPPQGRANPSCSPSPLSDTSIQSFYAQPAAWPSRGTEVNLARLLSPSSPRADSGRTQVASAVASVSASSSPRAGSGRTQVPSAAASVSPSSSHNSPEEVARLPSSVGITPATLSHPDMSELSILPLIISPDHHDLPVIDAPGCSSTTLVRCRAADCGKTVTLDMARHLYKNCHNCRGTYYCSRKCRRRDWERHKHDTCHGSRVSSACKRVIRFCGLDPDIKAALSRLARRGYLSSGRGCVMLGFPDLSSAEEFLSTGVKSCEIHPESNSIRRSRLELLPVYVSLRELRSSKMYGGGEILERLVALCQAYNPDLKFLLNVGVGLRWNRDRGPQGGGRLDATPTTPLGRGHLDLRAVRPGGSFGWNVASASYDSTPDHLPREVSVAAHSAHSTRDSGYSAHSTRDGGYCGSPRTKASKHQKWHDKSSRGRSASLGSEDIGYGSLGDIRESVSDVAGSPPYSNTDRAFHPDIQRVASPASLSPLSPYSYTDAVLFYSDTGPRLKCPILQKCACLRLFNPAFDRPSPSPGVSSYWPHPESPGSRHARSVPSLARASGKASREKGVVFARRCGPTLILTRMPGSWYQAEDDLRPCRQGREATTSSVAGDRDTQLVKRKSRELTFANIQRRLRQRGVSLQHQFPEVYAELVDYVAGEVDHFPSRILFPVGGHGTGRMFTCVLMPEAEPDLRWTQSVKLLDNLDISRERVWGPLMCSPGRSTAEEEPVGHLIHPDAGVCGTEGSNPVLQGSECLYPDSKAYQDFSSQNFSPNIHKETFKMPRTARIFNFNQNTLNFPGNEPVTSPDVARTIQHQVCPRCRYKHSLVDSSTQTGPPVNSIQRRETVPALTEHCPTSGCVRRRFNTNFPIFSFPAEVLDRLTSRSGHPPADTVPSRQSMVALLLGHFAGRSILSRCHAAGRNSDLHRCPLAVSHHAAEGALVRSCRNPTAKTADPSSYTSLRDTGKKMHVHSESKRGHKGSDLMPGLPRDHKDVRQGSEEPPTPHVSGPPPQPHPHATHDDVQRILRDWKNDGGVRVNSWLCSYAHKYVNNVYATNGASWSCSFCEDPHPHSHHHQVQNSQTLQLRDNHDSSEASTPGLSSLQQASPLDPSRGKSGQHHHRRSRAMSHHREQRRQRQVIASENLQSDW